jgi:hypothetical protein
MMRFRTFIKPFLWVLIVFGTCFPDDEVFISMAGDCRYPAVATDGPGMYLTWIVVEGQQEHLYFKRSMDEGETWNSARKISNDNSKCLPPAIAVDSGIVHVAWIDFGETVGGELYYARSPDGGETWEKNRILFSDATGARYPSIICRDAGVYLVWQDGENKVYFKASNDRGRTWGNETIVGKVGTHSCFCFPPAFTVNENKLAVAWADFRQNTKGFRVMFSGIPLFNVSDKEVSVLNRNKKMVSSIICRTSNNNGRTWNKERILTQCKVVKEMKDEIDNPIMRSDGSSSYIFWLDRRNAELGELYFTRFDPAGGKGLIDGRNIFPTPTRSPKRPSVAIDRKGNLHLAWATFFNGKSTIHYGAINPAGNTLREKRDMTSAVGRYHNPVITGTPSGLLYLFWFNEPKGRWATIFLKISRDNGATWESWGMQTEDMPK